MSRLHLSSNNGSFLSVIVLLFIMFIVVVVAVIIHVVALVALLLYALQEFLLLLLLAIDQIQNKLIYYYYWREGIENLKTLHVLSISLDPQWEHLWQWKLIMFTGNKLLLMIYVSMSSCISCMNYFLIDPRKLLIHDPVFDDLF